jgi:F420-dependent oxidoreductase-like protein
MRREALVHEGIFNVPLTKEQGAVTGLGKPLKLLVTPERSSIPIYIAALGEKSVAGAAEYADGWIPFLYHPERASSVWGEALATGTAKRHDGLAPLEVVAGGMAAIGEGPETKALLDFARPMVALYVGGMGARNKNFYNTLFRQYGYEKEAEEIQNLYLDGKKKEAEAAIPLEFLEAMNLVGPESYVKERIQAFRESGVTNLQIMPTADDPAALVSKMKELINA